MNLNEDPIRSRAAPTSALRIFRSARVRNRRVPETIFRHVGGKAACVRFDFRCMSRKTAQRHGACRAYRKIGDSCGRAASSRIETRLVHPHWKKKKKRERKKQRNNTTATFDPRSRPRTNLIRDLYFPARATASSLSRRLKARTRSGCPLAGVISSRFTS